MENESGIPEKVELSGFREVDSSVMMQVHKVISSNYRKLSEHSKNILALHITLKPVHEREKSEKYEINVKFVDNGKQYFSEVTDRNLMTAVDDALVKITNELLH